MQCFFVALLSSEGPSLAGTLLVSVPERLLLSAHSAKKDTAFAQALSATNKQSTKSLQVGSCTLSRDVGQHSHSTSPGPSFWP